MKRKLNPNSEPIKKPRTTASPLTATSTSNARNDEQEAAEVMVSFLKYKTNQGEGITALADLFDLEQPFYVSRQPSGLGIVFHPKHTETYKVGETLCQVMKLDSSHFVQDGNFKLIINIPSNLILASFAIMDNRFTLRSVFGDDFDQAINLYKSVKQKKTQDKHNNELSAILSEFEELAKKRLPKLDSNIESQLVELRKKNTTAELNEQKKETKEIHTHSNHSTSATLLSPPSTQLSSQGALLQALESAKDPEVQQAISNLLEDYCLPHISMRYPELGMIFFISNPTRVKNIEFLCERINLTGCRTFSKEEKFPVAVKLVPIEFIFPWFSNDRFRKLYQNDHAEIAQLIQQTTAGMSKQLTSNLDNLIRRPLTSVTMQLAKMLLKRCEASQSTEQKSGAKESTQSSLTLSGARHNFFRTAKPFTLMSEQLDPPSL